MGIVCAAPAVAWAAHAGLGLQLHPHPHAQTGWVWVLVLAPVLEETAMRPLLQTGLRHQLERLRANPLGSTQDWRGHLANGGTALVFAALHMPANGVLALWWSVPALAIGEVWRRSSNGWACVLLHVWFNASLAAVTVLSR